MDIYHIQWLPHTFCLTNEVILIHRTDFIDFLWKFGKIKCDIIIDGDIH